jgi:hypothetical protein
VWEKVFQTNGPHKQARVAILISDRIEFRLKSVRRDNEGHFILIKGTIHQKKIAILHIYAPNTGAFIYNRKTLKDLRAQIDPNTVIVTDLNTPLSAIDGLSRQEINKETSELPHTLEKKRHGRYLQSISPNNQAIHVLFCSSWNSLENR